MNIQITPTVVRIDVTDAEVNRIRRSPTAPIGRARIVQWAENVVRSIGLTPEPRDSMLQPVVDHKRGVSNRGFRVTVFVMERESMPNATLRPAEAVGYNTIDPRDGGRNDR